MTSSSVSFQLFYIHAWHLPLPCVFYSQSWVHIHATGLLIPLSDLEWSSLVSVQSTGRAWISLTTLCGPALASTGSIHQSTATGLYTLWVGLFLVCSMFHCLKIGYIPQEDGKIWHWRVLTLWDLKIKCKTLVYFTQNNFRLKPCQPDHTTSRRVGIVCSANDAG